MEETYPLHDVTIEKIQPLKICEKVEVEKKTVRYQKQINLFMTNSKRKIISILGINSF